VLELVYCGVLGVNERKPIAAFFYGNDVPVDNYVEFMHFANNGVHDYAVQSFWQWYALWDGAYAERQRSNAYNVRHLMVFNFNGGPSVYGLYYPFVIAGDRI
jgi:hypothetical protein